MFKLVPRCKFRCKHLLWTIDLLGPKKFFEIIKSIFQLLTKSVTIEELVVAQHDPWEQAFVQQQHNTSKKHILGLQANATVSIKTGKSIRHICRLSMASSNALAFVPYNSPRFITCIEHHRMIPWWNPLSAIRGPDTWHSDWEAVNLRLNYLSRFRNSFCLHQLIM